ncbi:hypothetical protein NQ113_24665 [Bacillus pseudomycoides]|uniref:hypothetical protein n=1 Tax=Bacillus pseudomycoides TaxID=64104 RepID=UPI00215AB011|nr:hypothetical protein [Bacillus pseudomycoides]MCR8860367.1 hypothetical protein [Bacillus pseudomycoides]
MARLKESDLFEPVKEWLEEQGYEVFSEVSPKYAGNRRADIIGKHGPAIAIVEMKTSLSLELLDQAYFWKRLGHYIYVAIPRRTKQVPVIIKEFLKKEGIGLLEIDMKSKWIYQREKAKFNRPFYRIHWEEELLLEHKTWLTGGSAGGGYVTTYKLAMEEVKGFLKRQYGRDKMEKTNHEGWRTLKEILDHCETHYSQPKPSLSQALRKYEADWCECKNEKGRVYFRYCPVREEIKQ